MKCVTQDKRTKFVSHPTELQFCGSRSGCDHNVKTVGEGASFKSKELSYKALDPVSFNGVPYPLAYRYPQSRNPEAVFSGNNDKMTGMMPLAAPI